MPAMTRSRTTVVQAAGGAVWRRSPGGVVEVLLVHRPRYDDWTLPKGKLEPAESHEEGALREVEEETGLRCALGPELPATSYRDRRGRPKLVRYWAMTPVSGRFRPTDEVDGSRWMATTDAVGLLSYERDLGVLSALTGAVAGST